MNRAGGRARAAFRLIGLLLKLPGVALAAGRRYRRFAAGFLKETDAVGIPRGSALELLDGLKPRRIAAGLAAARRAHLQKDDE